MGLTESDDFAFSSYDLRLRLRRQRERGHERKKILEEYEKMTTMDDAFDGTVAGSGVAMDVGPWPVSGWSEIRQPKSFVQEGMQAERREQEESQMSRQAHEHTSTSRRPGPIHRLAIIDVTRRTPLAPPALRHLYSP